MEKISNHASNSDLLEITGTRIPYKNLGYPSLEAYINSSKEFKISNRGGVSIVYAVASNKTKHLTDLIKKQKSKPSKKKKTNLRTQNFKKIKMFKQKKRSISEFNFCLNDDVITNNKHDNINESLSSIEQWDINVPNQYKSITKFECLVCNFKTSKFNDWKPHIMSISHISNSQKINSLYSYVCSSKGCKVLLYGSENLLNTHKAKHLVKCGINHMSVFMAEVMKRFINEQSDIMYFCSHCKKYNDKPIHSDTAKSNINIKCPVKFYCKYCRVDFYSSPEMIDYHSLSVEHMTLKCYDKLCFEAQMKYKKVKLSEQSYENKKNLLPTVENEITANLIPLPNLVKDTSSFKKSDCLENTNKLMQTVQVNKSVAIMDVDSTFLLDQNSQVLNPAKSEITPNKTINGRSKFDGASTSREISYNNVTNFETEKVRRFDEDEAYGYYVTQRLRAIKNSTVKQNLKLEIDYLFYVKIKKSLQ